VQNDPASIAFAQLAEEYRRAGSYEEAIATCRAGLLIHPGYLSARVTLGRSLLETNDLEAAQVELDQVLRSAPENLAAIRGLAEIHHRRGRLNEALVFYRSALALAKHDPDLEQTIEEITRAVDTERPAISDGLSFEQAAAEFLAALDELEAAAKASASPSAPTEPTAAANTLAATPFAAAGPTSGKADAPVLPELERFLDAIHTYRQRRAV
jgi:tetratricopeptide (TPR) repeat protein